MYTLLLSANYPEEAGHNNQNTRQIISEFWECGGSYPMPWIYLHSWVGTGNKEIDSTVHEVFYMFICLSVNWLLLFPKLEDLILQAS